MAKSFKIGIWYQDYLIKEVDVEAKEESTALRLVDDDIDILPLQED